MSLLLDTCVLSEMVKPKPDSRVTAWLAAQRPDALYISTLTLGELQKGVEKLEPCARRTYLEAFLHTEIREGFNERTLSVDAEVALLWGRLVAQSEQAGQRMPYVDSLIAATALHHGLTLVTRNTRDVEASGVALFNPWHD